MFSLLILVNYMGSLSGSPAGLPGQEEAGGKLPVSEDLARQAMTSARYAKGVSGSMIPAQRQVLSTSAVNSSGAIRLVREKTFGGVAEPPKDMMSILSELSGGDKKKPAPIALKESDLDGEIISLGGGPEKEPRLKSAAMPEMGRGAGQEGVTLLSAPVDYKLFKSSDTWRAFANSRKLGDGAYDFSSYDLLILVSLSDFPSRIFAITGVERGKKETVVSYRVNPLAMASELPPGQRDSYASAPVPKGVPVRLMQTP
ncbi:MAG: hypothetical protein Q8O90_06480 [Elusimicrobiota bacterium]|nr:hypothetical protein [Elusimicrobiota bacterium]